MPLFLGFSEPIPLMLCVSGAGSHFISQWYDFSHPFMRCVTSCSRITPCARSSLIVINFLLSVTIIMFTFLCFSLPLFFSNKEHAFSNCHKLGVHDNGRMGTM